MVLIEDYLSQLKNLLLRQYGERLVYMGLQGSYLRGEANEQSDIDVMVVIDRLSVSDLDQYRAIIGSLEEPEKSCGFICSKTDLANWNPLEISQLLHGTKDYYGALDRLVPAYTQKDLLNFVKLSLNNLYHELCHRYIHADRGKNAAALPGTCKGVFFILQNLYNLRHGEYIPTKARLLTQLSGKDRAVLERSMQLGKGISCDFSESFSLLFSWCQETLQSL